MGSVSRLLKNTSVLIISNLATKGLSALFIVYLARYLQDYGFGQYNFALAFASVFIIFSDMGLDALTIKKLNPHANDAYAGSRTDIEQSEREFIPREVRYRRFRYAEDGQTRYRARSNLCRQLWNNPVIHWDGAVCSCTYDYSDRFCLGSLRESSFRDIWRGEGYRAMRRRFRENWENHILCRECSYAYEGGDCITGHMVEAHFFREGREV